MGYYCNKCKRDDLPDDVVEYSKGHYGRILCLDCQPRKRAFGKSERKRILAEPQTPEEQALFQELKKRGLRVQSQKWDGYKHIDLAIPDAKVNIEVDGQQHAFNPKQALADLKRTFYSFKKGWVTLRIPNTLVKNHLQKTSDYVAKFIRESAEELEDDDDLWLW